MNRTQQRQLIEAQLADIHEDDHCRIVEQANPFQLHLEMTGAGDRRYRVMLDLEEYDIQPPRLYILDETGAITWDRKVLPPPPTFLNGSIHPLENRDFFCIQGTFDFHSHPLHTHEPWDAMRNTWALAAIVAHIKENIRKPPTQKLMLEFELPNHPIRKIEGRLDIHFNNGLVIIIVGGPAPA